MVKIYNIHSNTITPKDFKTMSKSGDIFLLNEDLRYEIIDTDKMTVLKSSVISKRFHAITSCVAKIRFLFKRTKK